MSELNANSKDENVTRTLNAKDTPPSGHLLAPSRSSAAKTTFLPSYRKPIPSPLSSPTFRPTSRAASASSPSTSSPLTSKWASRVAHRVAATEQSNMDLHRATPEREEPSLRSTVSNDQILIPDSGTPSPSGSLAKDKPLPSRPVASVISTVSPSKDGRSLIDASEQPLHFSIDGNRHEWPTLTPRSVSAPERAQATNKINKVTPSSIPRKVSGTGNLLSTPTYRASRLSGMRQSLTVRDSKASGITERSSDRSFVSAEDLAGDEPHSPQRKMQSETGVEGISDVAVSDTPMTRGQSEGVAAPSHPVRKQSLNAADSLVELATPANDGVAKEPQASDKPARDITTPAPELRNQSPSPANFSRPRPGSIRISRLPSLSRSITTAARHQRTASRIPIADGKKATLVDIPSQAASAQPFSATFETSPSFGGRRLMSPTALSILDQGKMRRLQRVNTNGSTTSTASSSTRILDVDESRAASPEHASGHSSSDDDEVTTPVNQPHRRFPGLARKPSRECGVVHESDFQSDELDVPRLRRAPPSKSRFTGPLQTIHSQAVLPVYTGDGQSFEESAPGARFSGIANDLVDFRAARPVFPNKQTRQGSVTPVKVQTPAIGQEHNDGLRFQQGNDSSTHVHSTLSILEGQGTPPSVAVDNVKLQEMFGLLKRGVENPSKNSSLIANAAAADMFLGQSTTGSSDAGIVGFEGAKGNDTSAGVDASHDSENIELSGQAASKWSNSTPSGPAISTEISHDDPAPSIGYPSATRRPNAASSFFQDPARGGVGANSRTSSPTLGFGKQVAHKVHERGKNPRDSMTARANFARSTAASASKKIGGTPTATTRSVRKAENVQRGRTSLLGPSRVKSSPANNPSHGLSRSAASDSKLLDKSNNPRSRSKSRTVLDKINGFFSHKRDRKTELPGPPPVPALMQTKVSKSLNGPNPLGSNRPSPPASNGPSPHVSTAPEANVVDSIHKSTSTMTMTPAIQEPRSSSRATDASDTSSLISDILMDGDLGGNVVTLAQKLITKAQVQTSLKRKQRMLTFATVLNDAMINIRDAQISAEMARQMAEKAELCYRQTQTAVDMLQRLASSLVRSTVRR